MYCRNVIFSNAPLLKAIRYRNLFQMVPFFYFSKAPFSPYASHFPIFLEFQVEDGCEEILPTEDFLRKKGISEDAIKHGRTIPQETRVKREILHLLSTLTNFHFFEYGGGCDNWGIQMPMKDVKSLSIEEIDDLNNQTTHWTLRSYCYPGIADDLKILSFTNCNEYYEAVDSSRDYFTVNPNLDNNPEIKIPPYLYYSFDRYYSLPSDERIVVRQCIGLLYEGVELFDTKRSVSLLSIISSIEGMAKLDLKKYGNGEKMKPTARFLRYLKTYVAGKSEDKYMIYYQKRCDITHDGILFLGDLDLYGDIDKQNEDWRLRLEILQVARLAFYNWLRRKPLENN